MWFSVSCFIAVCPLCYAAETFAQPANVAIYVRNIVQRLDIMSAPRSVTSPQVTLIALMGELTYWLTRGREDITHSSDHAQTGHRLNAMKHAETGGYVRVFLSSVIAGYGAFRDAVALAVTSLGYGT